MWHRAKSRNPRHRALGTTNLFHGRSAQPCRQKCRAGNRSDIPCCLMFFAIVAAGSARLAGSGDLLVKRAENRACCFTGAWRVFTSGRCCAVTNAARGGAAAAAELEICARRTVASILCRTKNGKRLGVLAINRAGVNTAANAGGQRKAAAGKIGHCQRLRVEGCFATLRGDRRAGKRGVTGRWIRTLY